MVTPNPLHPEQTNDAGDVLAMMYETCLDNPHCHGSIHIIADSIGWPADRMANALRDLIDAGYITVDNDKFTVTPAGRARAKSNR
jgi:Mn-dependent DtxR family transcriptional regulator